MFCTKCGNLLHDGDRFCAHCGAKVREEARRDFREGSKYEEVVFNPPFREEAEKRTRRIAEESPYSTEPKKEALHFDWNLEGFPDRDGKKDDDFELNWDEVIERRRDSRPVKVEKILPEEQINKFDTSETDGIDKTKDDSMFAESEPEVKASGDELREETLSIAALERELFGSDVMDEPKEENKDATIQYSRSSFPKEEQFYTYNAKRDAFQELLDKEKQRIEEMESRRKIEWEEIAPKNVSVGEAKKTPKFEEIFVEPELPRIPPVREVAVVVPPLTLSVMAEDEPEVCPDISVEDEKIILTECDKEGQKNAAETLAGVAVAAAGASAVMSHREDLPKENAAIEQNSGENNSESKSASAQEKEEPTQPFQEDKTKLRYSDVFPVDAFDDSSSDSDNDISDAKKKMISLIDEEDDDDDEEYKGNKIVKTLIIILAIIVVTELVIIGFKTFAPESGFSKGIDSIMTKITSIFEKDNPETEVSPENESSDAYMYQYVNELLANGENIGNISYNSDLTYDLTKTYAFEQIGQTTDFKNDTLADSEDGEEETYGRGIVEAVIGYYNGWQGRNDNTDLVGINSLEIGEIRSGDGEYFVLNKVTYAKTDGNTAVVYQTVRLINSAEGIIVDEMKEESL
ncbi:MAG: zinc-ribbon domain-containing protein [Firmicutes bacterium]|nr:zinc-ribbon domain-containing protein [Bacillota bacterium]